MKDGQITKASIKRLSCLLQAHSKSTDWKAIESILCTYHPNQIGSTNLDGLLYQGLAKACRSGSGRDNFSCPSSTLRLLLQKTKRTRDNSFFANRFRCTNTAIRCRNKKVLQAIINDDPSILFHCSNERIDDHDDNENESDSTGSHSGGATLLHVVCKEYGWNEEVAFLFSEILRHRKLREMNRGTNNGIGVLGESEDWAMTLRLSLEAGSDLTEILEYVRRHHFLYFNMHLRSLPAFIAEYVNDMELLRYLIEEYGKDLLECVNPKDCSTPLNSACYYQNEAMIQVLLEAYQYDSLRIRGKNLDAILDARSRLLTRNRDGASPLGQLLLSVGQPDAENAWKCIHTIAEFFATNWEETKEDVIPSERERDCFPIFHLLLHEMWTDLITNKHRNKIMQRIIHRLNIDPGAVDLLFGKTILSIVIEHLAYGDQVKKKGRKTSYGMVSLEILDYCLHLRSLDGTEASSSRTRDVDKSQNLYVATIKDGSGRLPLHSACAHSLIWEKGLKHIVEAYMPALEFNDPITGMPPFLHIATGAECDLNSIYELLRRNPGMIGSIPSKGKLDNSRVRFL